MKKMICLLLTVCLVIGVCSLFTACTPRDQKLIIYNWGEYMDASEYEGFEAWYKQKTGKKVKVEYREFDINETMHTKLSNGGDYDLVCPSDYMVQRLIREDKLQKLSQETLDVLKGTDTKTGKINPVVLEFAKTYDPNLEYSMPYIWGTMGIMYNIKSAGQNDEIMSSWDALWNPNLAGKMYMKDSYRDAYTVARLHDRKADLLAAKGTAEYDNIMNSIFNSATTATVNKAKADLQAQKSMGVLGYDVDMAKDGLLIDDGANGHFGMFWSCDAGYVMNGDEDQGANKNLRYIVPEEGSNVWVDNFVITKNAKNVDAANKFIQYLCEKDVAYACMDYAGGTSAVAAAAKQYETDLEEDKEAGEGVFKNAPAGFAEMYMDMMFPSPETLARCRIMKDFEDFNDELSTMWTNVMLS